MSGIENAPESGAFVYIYSGVGTANSSVQVDSFGKFQKALPEGVYSVFVARTGYIPFCKNFRVVAGKTVDFMVKLSADKDNLDFN
jgi:hypothetical protein